MGLADRDYMHDRRETTGAMHVEEEHSERHFHQRLAGPVAVVAAVTITLLAVYGLGQGFVPDKSPTVTASTQATSQFDTAQTTTTGNDASMQAAAQPDLVAPVPPRDDAGYAQTFPNSGTTQWFKPLYAEDHLGTLRLGDHSGIPGNKIIRIRDAFGAPVVQIYVQDGEGAELLLPIASYSITIAAGQTWYGPSAQFGSTAQFFRGPRLDVVDGESDWLMMPPGTTGEAIPPIASNQF